MNTNNKLTVGFWFGDNKPTDLDGKYFTYTFDGDNLMSDYKRFETIYEEFKERNKNPKVSYKNTLIEEECIIFFQEVEPQFTNFEELYLMSEYLEKVHNECEIKQQKLQEEINSLKQSKYDFLENHFTQNETNNISISDIFSQKEINKITSILKVSNDYDSFEKSLKQYLQSFKKSLQKRGYDYKYLSYVIPYCIFKEQIQ